MFSEFWSCWSQDDVYGVGRRRNRLLRVAVHVAMDICKEHGNPSFAHLPILPTAWPRVFKLSAFLDRKNLTSSGYNKRPCLSHAPSGEYPELLDMLGFKKRKAHLATSII